MRRAFGAALPLFWLSLLAAPLAADDKHGGAEVRIARATGPITVDGDLSDPGWQGAARLEEWFEVNPGNNVPATVKSVGYLTYDDRFLYAGFEFFDPDPKAIKAPYSDHDAISSDTDYGGIFVDPRNDGKTGIEFIATPRGVQFDAVRDDQSGVEDDSPDFFWDSAARITEKGWTLEIRIPFSSLRYAKGDPQTWGVALFRNYPRDFRRQIFTVKLPRGGNCFVCHWSPMTGLSGLPAGGHVIAAPYVSLSETGEPRDGLGTPFVNRPAEATGGLDVKWIPSAATSIDATIHPDFSQVESDVAQISANQRFALFYPEKRPFFLEGLELFNTPINAVYTRSITAPRWGARATGKIDSTSYTVLVAEDRGGGSAILPGPNGSSFADQDLVSTVAVGRLRRDLGGSFVSFLGTDREIRGGAYNRVFGPDFQLRPGKDDTVTGQVLFSRSATPNRPDLADEWDGRKLSGHGADVWWNRSTETYDATLEYKDFSDGFRADDGFVPQVGYREGYGEVGYTVRPKGLVTRVRGYFDVDYQADREGRVLMRTVYPGFGLDGPKNSFLRVNVTWDRLRAQDTILPRRRLNFTFQISPFRWMAGVLVQGNVGEQIDFAEARTGHGGEVYAQATFRPTDHLAVQLVADRAWLDVAPAPGADERRLFTAQVERVKATYTFSSRAFVRLIGQYVRTDRDPSLFSGPVSSSDGRLSLSALLAYKLNWQSVLFLGWGDNRALSDTAQWEHASRQLFLKVSYAFQK